MPNAIKGIAKSISCVYLFSNGDFAPLAELVATGKMQSTSGKPLF
jgi:hypothetical protein